MTEQTRYKKSSPFKIWLRQHGITQQSVADVLGISRSSMSQKLNGGIAWSEADLRHINSTYGLSADFVLGLNKPRHESEARGQGMDQQLNCPDVIQVNSTLSPLLAGGAR